MSKIRVKVEEKEIEFESGKTLGDLLKILDSKKDVIAGRVNGKLVDLSYRLNGDSEVEFVKIDSPEGLDILRHTTSHIMAQAVKRLYPKTKLAIGPTIENGFYYDFDIGKTLSAEDLPKIEKEMKKIVKENLPIERIEIPREKAIEMMREAGEKYKLELLEEMEDEYVSFYKQGEFIDMCRGPHLPSTGYAKVFKLLSVAGAYWRGDENREMLQRIYGTAYDSEEKLKEHLHLIEEAKRRDHRILGKQLELFSLFEETGPGLVLYLPKGAIIRRIFERFEEQEHLNRGYQLVCTPHIYRAKLWKISGHYDFYNENMFFIREKDEEEYAVKPMNCPGHVMMFKRKIRSYRDLPIRYFEFGTVYRKEKTGVIHGIMRARGFTQDDGHIFCTKEQLQEEIKKVLDFSKYIMSLFGFEQEIYLSTRPEKYMGTLENWEIATNALIEALKDKGLPYEIDEGEGVFYGPKIDIYIRDALGRRWQCTTIQVDFNFPEKFDLTYINKEGKKERVVMVHRALIGSWERFFGILIEHFAGAFPIWLSPVQVMIIPVSENFITFAEKIYKSLVKYNLRVEIDRSNEKVGYKIRRAEMQKIPYMLVVGSKELESKTVSVRKRKVGDIGRMVIEEFIARITEEINKKAIN